MFVIQCLALLLKLTLVLFLLVLLSALEHAAATAALAPYQVILCEKKGDESSVMAYQWKDSILVGCGLISSTKKKTKKGNMLTASEGLRFMPAALLSPRGEADLWLYRSELDRSRVWWCCAGKVSDMTLAIMVAVGAEDGTGSTGIESSGSGRSFLVCSLRAVVCCSGCCSCCCEGRRKGWNWMGASKGFRCEGWV